MRSDFQLQSPQVFYSSRLSKNQLSDRAYSPQNQNVRKTSKVKKMSYSGIDEKSLLSRISEIVRTRKTTSNRMILKNQISQRRMCNGLVGKKVYTMGAINSITFCDGLIFNMLASQGRETPTQKQENETGQQPILKVYRDSSHQSSFSESLNSLESSNQQEEAQSTITSSKYQKLGCVEGCWKCQKNRDRKKEIQKLI